MSATFCTLFDSNYLTRGVTMLRSLKRHHREAFVYVLCMDEQSHQLLSELSLADVHLIRLSDIENKQLLTIKPGRSVAEYCWTLSSWFCAYLMETHLDIEKIIYLDADLMFFSDPAVLLREAEKASITIIEHRFQPWNRNLESYGRFNVQWVGFRRDTEGLACLLRWRDQCLEWCFSRMEDGKMGDQKYLDTWPEDYKSVHVLKHIGAGVGPWNFSNYPVKKVDGAIYIDNEPLVFYHFHQFQILSNGNTNYMSSRYSNGRTPPHSIYEAYIEALNSSLSDIQELIPNFNKGIKNSNAVRLRRLAQIWIPLKLKNLLKRL